MAVKKAAREGLGTRLHVSHSGNFNNRDEGSQNILVIFTVIFQKI